MPKLIKFTQGTIDGEGKLIPLGRVFLQADAIVGFHNLVNDKKVMKNGCAIMVNNGSGFVVMEDIDEVVTELGAENFA